MQLFTVLMEEYDLARPCGDALSNTSEKGIRERPERMVAGVPPRDPSTPDTTLLEVKILAPFRPIILLAASI